jgi:hypothetical protein
MFPSQLQQWLDGLQCVIRDPCHVRALRFVLDDEDLVSLNGIAS